MTSAAVDNVTIRFYYTQNPRIKRLPGWRSLPDCVRFRADGVNELEGFLPDVDAGWIHGESAESKLEKLVAILELRPL